VSIDLGRLRRAGTERHRCAASLAQTARPARSIGATRGLRCLSKLFTRWKISGAMMAGASQATPCGEPRGTGLCNARARADLRRRPPAACGSSLRVIAGHRTRGALTPMAIAAETVGNKSDRACDALRARPCPSGRLLARRRAGSVAVGGGGPQRRRTRRLRRTRERPWAWSVTLDTIGQSLRSTVLDGLAHAVR
jgi:hypothetical protein